jgi:hypothetical protein
MSCGGMITQVTSITIGREIGRNATQVIKPRLS